MRMAQRLIPAESDGVLYALYGDPDNLERGGHPYWLIMVLRNPYTAPRGLKCAQGKTIAVNNWIVNARWLSCVSDDPNHKAYELLPITAAVPRPGVVAPAVVDAVCLCGQVSPHVHVRMSSFITELGLTWGHYAEGRGERRSSGVLADESHLAIMRHNFSNVA